MKLLTQNAHQMPTGCVPPPPPDNFRLAPQERHCPGFVGSSEFDLQPQPKHTKTSKALAAAAPAACATICGLTCEAAKSASSRPLSLANERESANLAAFVFGAASAAPARSSSSSSMASASTWSEPSWAAICSLSTRLGKHYVAKTSGERPVSQREGEVRTQPCGAARAML